MGNLWGKPPVKAPASTALAVPDWRHDVMVRPFDLARFRVALRIRAKTAIHMEKLGGKERILHQDTLCYGALFPDDPALGV